MRVPSILAEGDEPSTDARFRDGLVLRGICDDTVVSYVLSNSGVATIGRGADADFPVRVPSASRRHALIRVTPTQQVEICDLGSANGTFVRRTRLSPNVWTEVQPRQPFSIAEAPAVIQQCEPGDQCKLLIGPEAFQEAVHAESMAHESANAFFGVCIVQCDGALRTAVDGVAGMLAPDDVLCVLTESSLGIVLSKRGADLVGEFAAELESYLQYHAGRPSVRTVMNPPEEEIHRFLPKRKGQTGSAHETARPKMAAIRSPKMQKIQALVNQIAPTSTNVLIFGATGTGKEVLARAIHERSPRASGPLIALNCAALPENLLESELFGYEKGAFTGAAGAKPGHFELAHEGTLFLDEIGDMPLLAQAKLLRVLAERSVLRLGGIKPRPTNARVIAATNRDLAAMITKGEFRADLYYRLNQFSFTLPLLREREDSVIPLALHFAANAAETLEKRTPTLTPEVHSALLRYTWPGNVRELRSVIERAVLLAQDGVVLLEHLADELTRLSEPSPPPKDAGDGWEAETSAHISLGLPSTDEVAVATGDRKGDAQGHAPMDAVVHAIERFGLGVRGTALTRELVLGALERCGGNQTEAAKVLGISRRTLIDRIERFGIARPRKNR